MNPWQGKLLDWYRQAHRPLPWRQTRDPYAILLSEILLQQTRVDQALPYYQRFLARFPTLNHLALAPLEEVLLLWQGLGYYTRARNLHRLAQQLGDRPLPTSYTQLLRLPGLGPYTAAAVASIAFGQPVAAVDGNIRRVIARVTAQSQPTPSWLAQTAQDWLPPQEAGDWNQALMDLGATGCTPRQPRCPVCPLQTLCMGQSSPEVYPAPTHRSQKRVELVALVLLGPQGVWLEQRSSRSLGGLWGVPTAPELETLLQQYGLTQAQPAGQVSHAFTHRRLTIQVYWAAWSGAGFHPDHKPLAQLDRKILAQALPLAGHQGIVSSAQDT